MTSFPDALRARQLSYGFGSLSVLHGVDVDLPWGAVTAIAGPNGAGKSTLIEILAGVRQSLTGSIERADHVALVVQRVSVPDALPLTVREVVAMGTWGSALRRFARADAVERKKRIAEALDRVQLTHLAASPFTSLSGGQRQRVLLAQGIASQARIFLLDEPAAGLDAESQDRTRAILAQEAARGAAVACVSHDQESIAAADHIITLRDGRRI